MANDENIEKYMSRVLKVVNSIRGLGEELKDTVVVKKVLRTLPSIYNAKVSVLEERDLSTVSIDELQSTLVAYEMRVEVPAQSSSSKEVAFKSMEKLKITKEVNKSSDIEKDEIIACLSKSLKRGTGKYKGKLPLKCFKCRGIGHFAAQCPEKSDDSNSDDEESDSDDEEEPRFKKKNFKGKNNKTINSKRRRNFRKRRSLITKEKEDTSSDDSSNDDEESSDEALFMTIENNKISDNISSETSIASQSDEEDEEGVVDLELELIAALECLKIEEKKNRKLTNKLESIETLVSDIKINLVEAEKMLEEKDQSILKKNQEIEYLETEIVTLRSQAKKGKDQKPSTSSQECENCLKWMEAQRSLEKCYEVQKSFNDKRGIGYNPDTVKDKGKGKIEESILMKRTQVNPKKTQTNSNRIQQKQNTQINNNKFIGQHRQINFYGHCYSCNTFGHKASNCRVISRPERLTISNKFDALEILDIECFRCHRYGHIARNCRTVLPAQKFSRPAQRQRFRRSNQRDKAENQPTEQPRPVTVSEKAVWRVVNKKDNNDKSLVVQAALKAKSEEATLILDNGYSSYIIGDKSKLHKVNNFNGGSVKFGNNDGAKIVGKGSDSLKDESWIKAVNEKLDQIKKLRTLLGGVPLY